MKSLCLKLYECNLSFFLGYIIIHVTKVTNLVIGNKVHVFLEVIFMPFPALLIGAAAVVAGAVGVGKTVKAVMDNNEAEDINDSANSIVSKASSKADSAKKYHKKVWKSSVIPK